MKIEVNVVTLYLKDDLLAEVEICRVPVCDENRDSIAMDTFIEILSSVKDEVAPHFRSEIKCAMSRNMWGNLYMRFYYVRAQTDDEIRERPEYQLLKRELSEVI
jgi:hypothetical protein